MPKHIRAVDVWLSTAIGHGSTYVHQEPGEVGDPWVLVAAVTMVEASGPSPRHGPEVRRLERVGRHAW